MFHLILPFVTIAPPPPINRLESSSVWYADARSRQYERIDQNRAIRNSLLIEVATGKVTVIDFLETGEEIIDVLLADPSRIIYTTDARGEKGAIKPTAIYIRETEKTVFPGLTTTPITNMVVTTFDASGQRRRYTFNITRTKQPQYLGVKIVSDQGLSGDVVLENGQALSSNLVVKGLALAVKRGYTQPKDPVVSRVMQWVRLTQQGKDAIAAARTAKVPVSVLRELAKIAAEAELKERLQPTPVEPVLPPPSLAEPKVSQYEAN